MAAVSHAIPYTITDCKVAPITGGVPGTLVDLPGIRAMSVKLNTDSIELRGDNTVIAAANTGLTCEWEAEEGGLSFEAVQVMTGLTYTDTGTTPNIARALHFKGDAAFPYFYLCGQAPLSDGVGSMELHVYQAKLSSELTLELKDGEFLTPTFGGQGVARASDKRLASLIAQETSAALAVVS